MTLFLTSLVVLIAGYFLYGLLVEKVFGIDPARLTPAKTRSDGMDFIEMPTWRVFLIQFLNIAGLGPIIGAIMGVLYGPAAFIWIVAGTIFGGAVHDFISAMMSIRSGGDSLPELVGRELGSGVKQVMRWFSIALLILVTAVFVITPATLLDSITPSWMSATVWIGIIFCYYMLATLLPIDKLIGRLYPLFGFALLFMAGGLLWALLSGRFEIPDGIAEGLYCRYPDPEAHPIFPMMFVSIACGAISGFHATQSPMMARCIKNERLARPVFYGAMVSEGIVALIWAAAAIAVTGGYDGLDAYLADHSASQLVNHISMVCLGGFGGILALLGVVAAPITTGDTALRSVRLIIADMFGVNQNKLSGRLLVSVPCFVLAFLLMLTDYDVLWRYFAWCNQTLAVFTLWAATVYLARHNRAYVITMLPAMFMTMVVVSYIFFAKEGFALPLSYSVGIAGGVTVLFTVLFARYLTLLRSGRLVHDVAY